MAWRSYSLISVLARSDMLTKRWRESAIPGLTVIQSPRCSFLNWMRMAAAENGNSRQFVTHASILTELLCLNRLCSPLITFCLRRISLGFVCLASGEQRLEQLRIMLQGLGGIDDGGGEE